MPVAEDVNAYGIRLASERWWYRKFSSLLALSLAGLMMTICLMKPFGGHGQRVPD